MPGNPRVVVTNLLGEGSRRALRETMRSRPDGLTIHPMLPIYAAMEAAGRDVEGLDVDSANFIGTPHLDDESIAMCVRRDVAESWQQVLDLGSDIDVGAVGSADAIDAQFIQSLGGPVRVIYGYRGTTDILDAVDRDELDATSRCNARYLNELQPDWYTEQKVIPVFWRQSPVPQEFLDELGTGLQSPDIPHLFDIVDATEEQENAFRATESFQSMQYMFVLPPSTPREIVLIWQRTLKAATEDIEFTEGAAQAEREVNYGSPAAIRENIRRAQSLTSEGRSLLLDLSGIE